MLETESYCNVLHFMLQVIAVSLHFAVCRLLYDADVRLHISDLSTAKKCCLLTAITNMKLITVHKKMTLFQLHKQSKSSFTSLTNYRLINVH